MSIIHELQSQHPTVRYVLFGLALVAVVALVGASGFSSMKSDVAVVMGSEVSVSERGPFARVIDATSALTARMGLLFGLQPDKPIVKQDTEVHLLPLSNPR